MKWGPVIVWEGKGEKGPNTEGKEGGITKNPKPQTLSGVERGGKEEDTKWDHPNHCISKRSERL